MSLGFELILFFFEKGGGLRRREKFFFLLIKKKVFPPPFQTSIFFIINEWWGNEDGGARLDFYQKWCKLVVSLSLGYLWKNRCFLPCYGNFSIDDVIIKQKRMFVDYQQLTSVKKAKKMVARPGIEPGTQGFSVLCSTDWATPPLWLLAFFSKLYNICRFLWKCK